VSTQSNDQAGEVPEADRLEQLAPVEEEPRDPETTTTAERASTEESEADEADLLEQMAVVNGEEDYPHGEEPAKD
jgi:hypothetical protein